MHMGHTQDAALRYAFAYPKGEVYCDHPVKNQPAGYNSCDEFDSLDNMLS